MLLAGLAAPVHLPRQQRRGDPETAWKEVGFLATIRVRGSEVVSRDFDLTYGPNSAASRWVFMGDQRTGLWASLSGLRGACRHLWRAKTWPRQTPRCAGPNNDTERIASHEDSAASSHAIHRKKKRIQSHYLMLPSDPYCPRLQLFASVNVLLHTVDSNARLTIRSLCIDPAVTLRSQVRKKRRSQHQRSSRNLTMWPMHSNESNKSSS